MSDKPHALIVLANGGEVAAQIEDYHNIQNKLLNGNDFIVGISVYGGNYAVRVADISAVVEMAIAEETPEWLRQ